MPTVQIKRLHELATIPKRATKFSGGWDITATEIVQEAPDFVICKLGFSLDFPDNYKMTLVPRSSITKTKWIMQNSPGLGDADYVQEYQIRFRALPEFVSNMEGTNYLTYPEFPYKVGDRIGQVYLEAVVPIAWKEVDEIGEKGTRSGGFGSTG
jgi:dUTPase